MCRCVAKKRCLCDVTNLYYPFHTHGTSTGLQRVVFFTEWPHNHVHIMYFLDFHSWHMELFLYITIYQGWFCLWPNEFWLSDMRLMRVTFNILHVYFMPNNPLTSRQLRMTGSLGGVWGPLVTTHALVWLFKIWFDRYMIDCRYGCRYGVVYGVKYSWPSLHFIYLVLIWFIICIYVSYGYNYGAISIVLCDILRSFKLFISTAVSLRLITQYIR